MEEKKRIDAEPPLTASIINAASRGIGSWLSVPRPGFPVELQSRSLARERPLKGWMELRQSKAKKAFQRIQSPG